MTATKINMHRVTCAESGLIEPLPYNSLDFRNADAEVTLFVPPHVADHTAAAFNRAMQAVPVDGLGSRNFQYNTSRQLWLIWDAGEFGWRAQSDEVTGDGDPPQMFAEGGTLFEVMDEIDRIESEDGCDRCPAMGQLTEIPGEVWLCAACFQAELEHQQGMAEMAGDDMAHAQRERDL